MSFFSTESKVRPPRLALYVCRRRPPFGARIVFGSDRHGSANYRNVRPKHVLVRRRSCCRSSTAGLRFRIPPSAFGSHRIRRRPAFVARIIFGCDRRGSVNYRDVRPNHVLGSRRPRLRSSRVRLGFWIPPSAVGLAVDSEPWLGTRRTEGLTVMFVRRLPACVISRGRPEDCLRREMVTQRARSNCVD